MHITPTDKLYNATITMHKLFLLGTLCATVLAAPVTQRLENRAGTASTWQPAKGTTTLCDKTTDKIIGFYVGPQIESVLTDACAAMMPPCAYPDRLADDTVCAQVTDWRLDGPKNSTQSANVETVEGNKISGWDVNCKSLLKKAASEYLLIFCSLSHPCCATRNLSRCLLDRTRLLWVLCVHARERGTRRLPHSARLWCW